MVKEPALYRWSSYRFNALGKANQYVSPHSVYLSLGKNTNAFSDIRLAITQSQPLGNSHFYAKLETMMMGQLCSPKPRGRPKKQKYKKIAKNLKQ